MATRRLNGLHATPTQVLRRLLDLEVAAHVSEDQGEAQVIQAGLWAALPPAVRCLFNADQWSSDVGFHRLSPLMGMAVRTMLLGADVLLVTASRALEDARYDREWALLRAHGSNTWSYRVPERSEAARELFGADLAEVDATHGAALVALWAAHGSRSEELLTAECLSVLRAAAGETERDTCPHPGEEHAAPARHARIALECEVFDIWGVPRAVNRAQG